MRAWVLHGVNDLRFEDVPKPMPAEGEALVRVKAAGICGSDIARVFVTGAHRHPLMIGHEFSGIVERTGEKVSDTWVGRRVGVYPLIPCRKCALCLQKKYELCQDYDYLGSRCDGGFAEYVRVPAGNLIALPGSISYEEAAMLEPLAVAVHAIRQGTAEVSLSRDSKVAIGGFGTIGILVAKCMLAAGYRNICVVGNKTFQRDRAMSIGILSECYCDSRESDAGAWLKENMGGVDIFFECTGRNEVLSLGVDSAKPSGKIVIVGNPCSDMLLEKDIYWKILRNQLTLTGTWNSSFTEDEGDDWHYAVHLLKTHRIGLTELITHRLPLEELDKGLAVMRDKKEEYGKIILTTG